MAAPGAMFPLSFGQTELINLFRICGINDEAAITRLVLEEGLEGLTNLTMFTESEIDNLQKRWAGRAQNAGRLRIGLLPLKRIKAAAYWIRQRQDTGQPLSGDLITQQLLDATVQEMNIACEGQ